MQSFLASNITFMIKNNIDKNPQHKAKIFLLKTLTIKKPASN